MAKSKRKKLTDKLDKLVRELTISRDNSICQHCRKKVERHNLHVSHVIPRSKGNALRWDLQNLKVLCFHCHLNWWHKNPVESGEWFKKTFPVRWEYLQERKEEIIKFTTTDLEEMVEYYKKKLKDKEKRKGVIV
jgi:5-methylcytosine-specific restriction endonuclease McrA